MSTSRQPVRLGSFSHAAIDRATLAIVLAIGMLPSGASRASDSATSADATTANESAAPSQQTAQPTDVPERLSGRAQFSPEELYMRLAPSVVTIAVMDENDQRVCSGSGFFVDQSSLNGRHESLASDERYARYIGSEGGYRGAYVLTNYHVIHPAVSAQIVRSNGDKATVTHVIAEDEKLDLALVLVTVPSRLSPKGIPLAPKDPLVMTPVYAIGSPLGLSGTASEGNVSAYRKIDGGHHWLQTTAPISPGSSGGPLLLADGTLAGVTTAGYTGGQNLNLAIPTSAVRTFLATSALRPRRVFVGASIHLQEQLAFAEMNNAVGSKRSAVGSKRSKDAATNIFARLLQAGGLENNDAKREAAATLSNAWRRLGKGPANEADSVAHYQKIIASAQSAHESLPDEFRYLAHYVVGKASLGAAVHGLPKDPNSATRTEERHLQYRASRYSEDALFYLDWAIELKPDFSPAYEQVYRHHQASGNWADALLASDALIRRMPRSAAALSLRAECYRALHQPASARRDLEAATGLSPRDPKLHFELANVLVGLGDYDEAIEAYQWALAACEPQLRGALHYHLGVAYRKAGNAEKALVEFRTAKALGWPAESCDDQIAQCQLRQGTAAASPDEPQTALAPPPTVLARRPSTHHERETEVYITKTGNKYHCAGCEHLARSRIPIALGEAAGLYEPCSRCRPPSP